MPGVIPLDIRRSIEDAVVYLLKYLLKAKPPVIPKVE